MKSIVRTAAAAGIVVGLSAFGAPSAMADIYIIEESGPGDTALSAAPTVGGSTLSKPVTTGAITPVVENGVFSSSPLVEVEGPEQDAGEGAASEATASEGTASQGSASEGSTAAEQAPQTQQTQQRPWWLFW